MFCSTVSLHVTLPLAGIVAECTFEGVGFVAFVLLMVVQTVFVFVRSATSQALHCVYNFTKISSFEVWLPRKLRFFF